MKKALQTLAFALVFPVVYLVMQVSVSGVAGAFIGFSAALRAGGDPMATAELAVEMTANLTLTLTLISALLTTVTAVILILARRQSLHAELHLRMPPLLVLLACIAMGAAANVATSWLIEVLPVPDAMLEQYENIVGQQLMNGPPWMIIGVVGVIVPIAEEITFRSMAQGSLQKGWYPAAAVILSSLIFAAAHMIPLQMLYVLPVAILLGLTFLWTDSLLATVAVHIGYNLLSAVLTASGTEEMTGIPDFAGYICIGAGIAVCAVCMWYIHRRRVSRAAVTAAVTAPEV